MKRKELFNQVFGLGKKRTRWVLIEETDKNGVTTLFLGLQPLRSRTAIKLHERRFVTAGEWHAYGFKRNIYPARKKVFANRIEFTALKPHNASSEELLTIRTHVDFIKHYFETSIYSKKFEVMKLL